MEEGKEMQGTTYKEAGVDIEAGNESTRRIKKHVKSTFNENVALDVGSFGGALNLKALKNFEQPIMIASIDGVGTKVKIAGMMNKWDSVGKDIVNHSANDILCQGAKPFFFLDYIATEKLLPEKIEMIIKGMSEACIALNMPLIAGETAEMPGVYEKGETDVAGTIIGVVDKKNIVDGNNISEEDVLIALPSNGLHTNGYSLARKVLFEKAGFDVNDKPEELNGESVGTALLKPHTSYSNPVLALMEKFEVKGIAHITGGGLTDNVPRILPEGVNAEIEKSKIKVLPIFKLIQEKGNVPEQDMYHSFNMGVGLVLVVSKENAEVILDELNSGHNANAYFIGKIIKGNRETVLV